MDIIKFVDRLDLRAHYLSESCEAAFKRRDRNRWRELAAKEEAVREIILDLLDEQIKQELLDKAK